MWPYANVETTNSVVVTAIGRNDLGSAGDGEGCVTAHTFYQNRGHRACREIDSHDPGATAEALQYAREFLDRRFPAPSSMERQ